MRAFAQLLRMRMRMYASTGQYVGGWLLQDSTWLPPQLAQFTQGLGLCVHSTDPRLAPAVYQVPLQESHEC